MDKRHIYTFKDSEIIYFAKGRFDTWCVYRAVPNSYPEPPRDKDYFAELLWFGKKYGCKKIYEFFTAIYNLTDKEPRIEVLRLIANQGKQLNEEDYLRYAKLMMTLYYAMIAEENRQPENRFPLKKKVKKIGVFQVLVLGFLPGDAANFSRKKKARELGELLRSYEAQKINWEDDKNMDFFI